MHRDRLVSLVLLLRQRGRLTADTLARELEMSTARCCVMIEALSSPASRVCGRRPRCDG
ncbi:hypothetical protein SBADM41S_06709 [Streptomyces badius]